ncbi:tripartite tricarboxylate transporter TctB family protein [Devosia sp. FKR38]|uniref:tripartite tricarboxylate transporter TctB family protein n=1 Tax=Devosia sp. FKR38 TaxID=2562312 RepID=UPI0010C1259F|nr:tripartite tricarboxylate transporter TctB family protein [Devosia sp. FKR38]
MSDQASPPSARFPWSQDGLAGLALVAFGAVMFWAGLELPFVTKSGGVGSGLLPRLLAGLVVLLGIAQLVLAHRRPGEGTGSWPLARFLPVFVGVVAFALTIRGAAIGPLAIPPLGMAVAAPLAIIGSGLAAKEARIGELVVFAVLLTAFCVGVFRYGLGLSIPVAPWLIGF